MEVIVGKHNPAPPFLFNAQVGATPAKNRYIVDILLEIRISC